jgi:two-component system sensor histidine kinase/response regulator
MNTGTGIKILYVDDEENNLIGFKASLRLEYKVFTTTDTGEAVQLLEEHPDMRIVFSDQRMPGKTGVEFFEEIRGIYPLPIRILVTGYTDVEAIIDAINRGHIFRYIKKPWTDSDLLSAIEEGNKFYLANSMLATRNEELKKAYFELDKFAYNVSHDIRSPITGILKGIDQAQSLDDIKQIKDILGSMEQSVRKLDTFIHNMYDYHNLQMGELLITFVDMERLINDQKDIYAVYANANNIDFSTSLAQQEPVRSDEVVLKMIITNLLSNAFKYQRKEQGHKKVSLSVEVQKPSITIVVRDNGIGIPQKDISGIFNIFSRYSSDITRSGYGLHNIKNALIKLGGDIEVQSTEHEETTFRVTIPNKM